MKQPSRHLQSSTEPAVDVLPDNSDIVREAIVRSIVAHMTSYSDWQWFEQHALSYSMECMISKLDGAWAAFNQAGHKLTVQWPDMRALLEVLYAFGKPEQPLSA